MSEPFFERPILNSPYAYPKRHWELDPNGQPTQAIIESRRRADFITPIPKPKKRSGAQQQITESPRLYRRPDYVSVASVAWASWRR